MSWLILLMISFGIGLFIWLKRDKFEIQAVRLKGFPILYMALYKSEMGLKLVDRLARKHRKLIRVVGTLCVVIGFIAMVMTVASLGLQIVKNFQKPEEITPTVTLLLPVKSKFTMYIPFQYWIISLFVVATVHELGHALLARAYNIPLEGAGFAFAGLIIPIVPAAYVKPNEEVLKNRPGRQRMAVMAAGGGFNILLGLAVGLVYVPFMMGIASGAVLLWIKQLVAWLFILNIGIGMFNLLPMAPLDGARMIDALGSRKAATIVSAFCLFLIAFSIVQGWIL